MQGKPRKPGDGTETALPAATAPSPELSDRPRRRMFTAQTKLRILAATDSATGNGGIGAILRISEVQQTSKSRTLFVGKL